MMLSMLAIYLVERSLCRAAYLKVKATDKVTHGQLGV